MKIKMNFFKKLLVIGALFLNHQAVAQNLNKGPFILEEEGGKIMLSIADSILNRDIVFVTKIAKAPTLMDNNKSKKIFAGSATAIGYIRFVKEKNGELKLYESNFPYLFPDVTLPLTNAVRNTYLLPLLAQFKSVPSSLSGYNKIEVTDWIKQDQNYIGVAPSSAKYYFLENQQKDKFQLGRIERFPEGLDFRSMRTYAYANGIRTVELNTTFLLLPKTPLVGRMADNRVTANSYNSISFIDFEKNPQNTVTTKFIHRYRIEPQKSEVQKYLSGKTVVPQKPIKYYLDPNTPLEWIPYFKKGIKMWETSFEKIGFKEAVQVEVAPSSEADFNYYSARYNTIDYSPSETYGGSADILVDPRSGEVISSRIKIPHSNPLFFSNRYMVLAGALDSGARKAQFSNELIGEIHAAIVAHEMGHTLGIHHNYLSSSLIPVEKLRDKNWVKKNGFSYSIMDYSRHNYVAQPEDNLDREGLIPRIGVYDHWAVEWLYTYFADQDPILERKKLNQLYNKRIKENPAIAYVNIDWYLDDFRLRMEDVGDDPIKATEYGLRNLKKVVPNILDWTKTNSGAYDYQRAEAVYDELMGQYKNFMQHVVSVVGGTMLEVTEPGYPFVIKRVNKKEQKEALFFLNTNLFQTQDWLLEPTLVKIMSHKGRNLSIPERFMYAQSWTLSELLSPRVFEKLEKGIYEDPNQYSIAEYLDDLEKIIFSEFKQASSISYFRRRLQNSYLRELQRVKNENMVIPLMDDMNVLLKDHLQKIKASAMKANVNMEDNLTKLHINSLVESIDQMQAKFNPVTVK